MSGGGYDVSEVHCGDRTGGQKGTLGFQAGAVGCQERTVGCQDGTVGCQEGTGVPKWGCDVSGGGFVV